MCSFLGAQDPIEPLAEKIKKISEDLLEGYAQPLVTAFVSKRLGPFEPVIGAGIEDTKVYFQYEFEYEIPDTINNIPPRPHFANQRY